MTLLTSIPVFHKKKINLIFVMFDVLFVEARIILDNFSSQRIFWITKRPYLKGFIM